MTIRLDKEIKNQAQTIFSELGVDMTTAINVFLRQAIKWKGFPFPITLETPNKVTQNAIEHSLAHTDGHGPFNSTKELMESLDAGQNPQ